MKQKIIGLGFGHGGYIGIGDKVFSGNKAAVVALITDNSVEYHDAMHRIYTAYTADNQIISSFENMSIQVDYEVKEAKP